ncbi:CoA-binding protein [Desertivibrio insolitus]|uniref:CoA-binding protein n=1 Tax=Herbiconiux sp. SYSU D00978 TaxID=2812562 RepID=UPI001A957630|nr:CoA-binding protein [Herbiconiux sp. SYSU D00978]
MSESELMGEACGIPADTPFGRALRASRTWTGPSDTRVRELLTNAKTIAIVGVSESPYRPSHDIARYLQRTGRYELYFVNPNATEVLGQRVYPDLASLPVVPDIVDVFRRSEYIREVAEEAVAIGAPTLWVQSGIWDADAARYAEEHGVTVVMDRCIKVDHHVLVHQ